MGKPLVLADRVSKRFERSGRPSVKDVTCRIMPGDRIAITGRSGSGKSTLLHMLAGLGQPTSGSVTWPVFGDREELRPRRIGFVPQAPSLFPALSVIENVVLPLVLIGQSDPAGEQAREMLGTFDLLELAAKMPQEISGGQAQRVAMARALVTSPALLIADEPTGQLDSVTGSGVVRRLADVAARTGATIVIATHDESIAANFETRWSMNDGSLTAQHSASQP